jgi:predicted Fe-S protein YdhL (DUF1289 family)
MNTKQLASKAAKARWKGKTKEERSKIMKEVRRKGEENKALKKKSLNT